MAAAILLLGAPGSGKSVLGQQLLRKDPAHRAFLNVGAELRKSSSNLLEEQLILPTQSKLSQLREIASNLIRMECKQLVNLSTNSTSNQLLILECVKGVEDAESLLTILREEGVQLIQTLLLPNRTPDVFKNGFSLSERNDRDSQKKVAERQQKWERNASRLIEIFASLGNLCEVVEEPEKQNKPRNLLSRVYGSETPVSVLLCNPIRGLTFKPLTYVVSPRLVTIRSEKEQVLLNAARLSGLSSLLPDADKTPVPMPKSLAGSDDAKWVSYPGRYLVSRKCDGTRQMLIVDKGGKAYFLNRAGMMYAYPSCTDLPEGTILDGELLWISGHCGFFLAFDAVAIGAARTWQLSLEERLNVMEQKLGLVEAESCDSLRKASVTLHSDSEPAGGVGNLAGGPGSCATQTAALQRLLKITTKQKAPPPGEDTVTVLSKRHIDVSASNLETLRATLDSCPYPTDGLVFSPRGMPWGLKMEELLLKWQPAEHCAVDVAGQDLDSAEQGGQRHTGNPPLLVPRGLVCECQIFSAWTDLEPVEPELDFSLPVRCFASSTQPVKQSAKGISTVGTMAGGTGRTSRGFTQRQPEGDEDSDARWEMHPSGARLTVSRPQIRVQLVSVRWDKVQGAGPAELVSFTDRVEKALSYDQLVTEIRAWGAASLHRSGSRVPPPSGGCESSSGELHPARTLPFLELYALIMEQVSAGTIEHSVDDETGLEVFNAHASCKGLVRDVCRGLVCHPQSALLVATPFRFFPSEDAMTPNAWFSPAASASLKIDGTMATAFLWRGRVRVATRRRMDSEQAIWAQQWLEAHAVVSAMQPSWTYVFEVVSSSNRVVVHYEFDGLVLLGAVSPEGSFASPQIRKEIAQTLGVVAAPFIEGKLHSLLHFLPQLQGNRYPSNEGWVVTMPNGSLRKMVHGSYQKVKLTAQLLHPLTIWDRVRLGASVRQLTGEQSHHFRLEMFLILEALQKRYQSVRDLLLTGRDSVSASTESAQQSRFEAQGRSTQAFKDLVQYWKEAKLIDGRKGVPSRGRSAAVRIESRLESQRVPVSMFFDRNIAQAIGSDVPVHLRCRILECIKPDWGGHLQGYTPSANFKQTFAKGWKAGPMAGRLARNRDAASRNPMEDELILLLVLQRLDDLPMVKALAVCHAWRLMVKSDSEFPRHLRAARIQVAARRLASEAQAALAQAAARAMEAAARAMAWHSDDSGSEEYYDMHRRRLSGYGSY
eukprot:2613624-Rhodomonas_salina.1